MTWQQAREYARAGTPVRREPWLDPIMWITHTTGIFWYHEQTNQTLPDPVIGNSAKHVVRNTEFGLLEFTTADWTTYGPDSVIPPLEPTPETPPPLPPGLPPPPPPPEGEGTPTSGGYPPFIPGVSPATPVEPPVIIVGGAGPGGGSPPKPPDPPKKDPPASQPMPVGSVTGITGIAITVSLTGIPAGTSWSVVVTDAVTGEQWNLGILSTGDTENDAATPTLEGGHLLLARFTCNDGPQSLRGKAVGATTESSD